MAKSHRMLADGHTECGLTNKNIRVMPAPATPSCRNCRDAHGEQVKHVHVTAPYLTLEERYENRRVKSRREDPTPYAVVHANALEAAVDELRHTADLTLDSSRLSQRRMLELTTGNLP